MSATYMLPTPAAFDGRSCSRAAPSYSSPSLPRRAMSLACCRRYRQPHHADSISVTRVPEFAAARSHTPELAQDRRSQPRTASSRCHRHWQATLLLRSYSYPVSSTTTNWRDCKIALAHSGRLLSAPVRSV